MIKQRKVFNYNPRRCQKCSGKIEEITIMSKRKEKTFIVCLRCGFREEYPQYD